MGLFGSLYSSTTGMLAASRATQVTSTNIANMTTTGFKRSDTAFSELVNNSLYTSPNNVTGGVSTTKILRAGQQGGIQQTGSILDASISGNGFFAVKNNLDPESSFYYTRNGQFGESVLTGTDEIYLKNSAGFYLYGWPTDTDGNTIGGSTDPSSLQPLEIGLFATQTLPTSRIDLAINLDASETDTNPALLGAGQTLPVNNTNSDFQRSVTVYDNLGTGREVSFQFRKITGPQAQVTSNATRSFSVTDVLVDNLNGPTPGITAGDTMAITNSAGTLNITFVNGPANTAAGEVNTMADLRTVINSFVAGPVGQEVNQFEARIGDSGQLFITSPHPSESIDISGSSANVLGAGGFNFVADPVDGDYIYDPMYDTTLAADPAGPYPDQGDFPALQNVPNTQGWWEVSVLINDPAAPNGSNKVEIKRGMINFNGNGTINTADPTLNLATTPIDFDSAATGEELAGLTVNMTGFGQYAGAYSVINSTQNGAPLGERTNVSIQNNGLVVAEFTNGAKVPIYRVPLARFANPEGLTEYSGTVFAESPSSGVVEMFESGTNGTGDIYGATLENSNVDVAEEFGDLIVYQRSFGLNSKVINAVDEMTQTLVRLKS